MHSFKVSCIIILIFLVIIATFNTESKQRTRRFKLRLWFCDFSSCVCFLKDGQIDADELQRCLTQSGIAGGYKRKCSASRLLQKRSCISHSSCPLWSQPSTWRISKAKFGLLQNAILTTVLKTSFHTTCQFNGFLIWVPCIWNHSKQKQLTWLAPFTEDGLRCWNEICQIRWL